MLSQLLFVRLKAAENALRDGRLDEAYRLATAPDIREHRRGAAVLAGLTERFIERARNHFRADRFTEAHLDLDRAETGDVMKEEIADLRQHVQTVDAEQKKHDQSRRDRLATAKRRIEGGSLVAGRKILEQASKSDLDAQRLAQNVDARVADVGAIVDQADKLIAQGQLAAAAERVRKAKSIDAHRDIVARIETRLCKQVLDNAGAAVKEGRIARASDELRCLGQLGSDLPARRELTDMLAMVRDASHCLRTHDYATARRHMLNLGRLIPKASWVKTVAEQLQQVDETRTALSAGPLGDRMGADEAHRPGGAGELQRRPNQHGEDPPRRNLDDTVAIEHRARPAGELPDRLLLLVDGGGSFLLLRSPQASIGRVAARNPADVPLFSDLAERHANVTRVDDDYFLFSGKDVEVSGRKTKHQLLRDGDRIVLGRKAKLTFRLPSRKSPTGVLDLSDTTKMPNDVRRIVLFHRQATVGAGRNAHIQCQHAGTALVLFERNGALWMRQKNDGHVDTEPVELALGKPIEIAGVSLVLGTWEMRTPGSWLA